MFEVKDVSIMIYTRYIVKSLSFTINKGDKLAIIGEEGNGKSTLLKSLLGICEYSNVTGIINFNENTVGYLEQSINDKNQNIKIFDFLFIDQFDYYDKVNKLYKLLESINLDDSILEQYINTLSGGEKVKVRILKLLLNDYDILFLDEPTNDLDIETLEWLEKFINSTTKPIIYVSHDETLLANTANIILHLEQIKKKTECKCTLFKMDYDTYIRERIRTLEKQNQIAKFEKNRFDKQQEKLNRIMQKVEYQQNTISRKDPHGAKMLKKKMHSLKSQEKKFNSKILTEVPDIEERISFSFENISVPKTKKIIELNIKELKVNKRVLSKNIKLDIIGNSHICIIGKNGVGKTTLIKQIYEKLKLRTDIKVGYMPQSYDDILNNYTNVLDFISSKSKEDITKTRMYLGNLNFTKEEMTGKILNLSNGTKAKLFLIKLVLDKCNVLILDEPTRNLSPLSNPVIRKVLKDFNGTIISISHDRKYISEVINELYVLNEDGIIKL